MELPELKIGPKTAKYPFVQGGMAVRISTGALAAAVAAAGGVGTIGATGMDVDELRDEIRMARRMTDGIFGVNVLFAVRKFPELVKAAMAEGVDFIVSGAGFSRDMFAWGADYGVPVVPIVSSGRLAEIATRLGAAAIVVEGTEAGGHLGTDRPLMDIFPEVRKATPLPLIAAGGIANGTEAAPFFAMGADGVQLATRFIACDECTVPRSFKEMHVGTPEDEIVLVDSPVGMPGRAIRNQFSELLRQEGSVPISGCDDCLKRCSREYCILEALDRAQKGDIEGGLVFSGSSATRIHDILPAKEILERLVRDAREALAPHPTR